eukprot:TRINITY_DN20759_c0_g1_i1.p1 TRINITY_DN20759_c0_g1~~TRINITY_DN20759_c0_g1_i1.p1  ORF type:complete len:1010 (+),score=117.39 TRINITY_DN20759_c0_g1_i1:158-3187(+)
MPKKLCTMNFRFLGAVVYSFLARETHAHGAVTKPMPRKVIGQEYCPWCVGEHQPVTNAFGAAHHDAKPSSPCMGSSKGDEHYAASNFGGYTSIAGPGEDSYTAGGKLDAVIVLDADHNGDARWSYCPHSEPQTEACFEQRPLTDWTDVHAYWGGDSTQDHWKSGQHFPQTVSLPADVPSGPVTLRWLWVCKYTDELFVSCVDTAIVGGSDNSASSTSASGSSIISSTTLPLTAAAPASTTSASGPCGKVYAQCGGKGFTGSSCCEAGSTCVFDNDYYSQCKPGSGPSPPSPSPAPPTPSPSPSGSSPSPSPAPSGSSPTPNGPNPFVGHPWYVNPSYRDLLANSINITSGLVRTALETMQKVPSAYWIDVKSKIYKGQGHPDLSTVEGILENAASCSPPSLVVLIVYDLPNRDCYALASNGEICCHYGTDVGRTKCNMSTSGPNVGFYREEPGADCADGLKEYRETYIDPFAEVVSRFADKVPVVLVIEPDSLPNLVTNMADKRPDSYRGCHQETKISYEQGVRYAVEKFSTTGAQIYVDAGHGGWLGWANSNDDQTGKFADIIKSMHIANKIRGFATNVANYQPLGSIVCPFPGTCKGGRSSDPCCSDDPCGLQNDWNWAHNELNYVDVLDYKMKAAIPGFAPGFVIDTGRNGRPDTRSDCSNWCNARGAGVGKVPSTDTADSRIDAYLWLKTPGESDGCTEQLPDGSQCPRFDEMCASIDSLGSRSGEPRAPEAGLWYHFQISMLATNADMGDASAFQTAGSCGVAPSSSTGTTSTTAVPTSITAVTDPATTSDSSMAATSTSSIGTPQATTTAVAGFVPVDGGTDRACRGAGSNDNSASYYVVTSANSLETCQQQCVQRADCHGIELGGNRCELWTRPEGIGASISLAGYTCQRYLGSPPLSTALATTSAATSLHPIQSSCGQLHDQCGGDQNYRGARCCVSGLTCEYKDAAYSQCLMQEQTSYACSQLNQQCGGAGWQGFTCCAEGLICVYLVHLFSRQPWWSNR